MIFALAIGIALVHLWLNTFSTLSELWTSALHFALSPHALTMALVAAHMIIFWLSQDSNVTPPVCLTAFAAAAITGTPAMRTGLTAWKIAKGLYIVPPAVCLLPADFRHPRLRNCWLPDLIRR
ncbi:hypothetical protein [Marinobacter sp.]|uniref:hypothetical protein n=1 Tax=Marinobacter sp. TaxID=50741 RepID=UPI0035612FAD